MFVYLLIINALSLLLMRADKQKAIKGLWRIPETVLFTAALLGGSLGILLGMQIFRHKTRKIAFYAGIPTLLLVQGSLILLIIKLGA